MSQQNKKVIEPNPDINMIKELFCKNKQAIKSYWPILFLAQLPVLIIYMLLTYQKPFLHAPATPATIDKKNIDILKQQSIHVKNLEQRFNELNKRFVALQIQHAKFVKSSILLAATVQQGNLSSINSVKKITLDTLDRIGEKIRLNEPFSGLITSLPKECSSFPEYKTLQHFSARLPLTFIQLKKAFADILKSQAFPKVKSTLPKWLEKIASAFQGKIKIEKVNQVEESPFESITDALEMQDLKLAYSLAKDIQIQPIKLWAMHVAERILLDEQYASFAEKIQNWVQQTPLANETSPTNTTPEKLP